MTGRYDKLKGILEQKDISIKELSDKINVSTEKFNMKLNRYDGEDFTLTEAKAISKVLNEPINNFFLIGV